MIIINEIEITRVGEAWPPTYTVWINNQVVARKICIEEAIELVRDYQRDA
ncbi:MAG: hypothetical protein IJU41_03535 [Clostridia bacterium]|nr:hypothetical protein [Clostridia bacterium]